MFLHYNPCIKYVSIYVSLALQIGWFFSFQNLVFLCSNNHIVKEKAHRQELEISEICPNVLIVVPHART